MVLAGPFSVRGGDENKLRKMLSSVGIPLGRCNYRYYGQIWDKFMRYLVGLWR